MAEIIKNCLICNSTDFRGIKSPGNERYVKCLGCGLVFTNPRRDAESVRNQYLSDASSTSDYYRRTVLADKKTHFKQLKAVNRYTGNGSLLDIGCNVGSFMDVAERCGWDTYGIEPNPVAAAECRSKHPNTFNEFFDSGGRGKSFDNFFDLVTMLDVIEHFPDPGSVINQTKRYLKDKGILLIVTPDFSNPMTRRFHMKPDEHLVLFNGSTIRRLLNDNGFDVILSKSTSRYKDFRALKYSTTDLGHTASAFADCLCALNLDRLASAVLFRTINDELLVIARKR